MERQMVSDDDTGRDIEQQYVHPDEGAEAPQQGAERQAPAETAADDPAED